MTVKLRNVRISGGKVGIRSDSPVDLDAENLTFDNVEQPFDIRGARSVNLKGSRIRNDPRGQDRRRSSVGWRRLNGPPLPVFCPQCKSIFPSHNYNFSGAYFNAWNNEEPCQECGFEHAILSEGAFDLAGEAVRILNAPDITHAMLKAINQIADDLLSGKSDPDESITKFEAVSPGLAALARKALELGMAAVFFLGAVAGIAALVLAQQQIDLAREQVDLARQQVVLQKEANASSDQALKETLDALASMKFRSDGGYRTPQDQNAESPSAGPAQNKAAAKSPAPKLKRERKLKTRDLRRKAELERRKALNRRPQR